MLRAAAALTAFPLLASAAPAWIPASKFDLSRRDNSSSFISCLSDAGLDPVVQADTAYANDSAAFNLRLEYQPVALVYPSSADDTAAAVKCASTNNVKSNARSGGHSYAAYGLGGEDGHLVISLDNMKDITVDGEKASIGAGNRLGDVVLGLYSQGERAMAHGTCPYVGIGGHAGHGGFGLPSRAWGTLLDQVYEVEVVVADGSVLTANNETNSDLYWALKGADSSFGVVTTFKTITHAAPVHNVWFSYEWTNFTSVEASDAIQKWQNFSQTLTNLAGLQIHINPQGDYTPNLIIDGVYYGDDGAAGANATLAPLLAQLSTPNISTVEDQDWLDSAELLAGSPLNASAAPDTHDTFFADSVFISQDALMTQAASDAFAEYLWSNATAHNDELAWYVIFDLWGGEGSYISSIPADATSFDARDALYSIQFYSPSANSLPPYPADGIAVTKGMLTAITGNMPDVTFKGYANYIDPTLSRDEAHAYYYPTHTEKLEQLKATWDPQDVFEFPQAFLPSS